MIGFAEYLSNSIINLIESLGYWGVFLSMTLESACIPIPSFVIMPFAGFAVYQGKMTLLGITIVGVLGNLFGSLIAYYVGLWGGRPLLENYGKYILITPTKLDLADEWFKKYGHEAVLISRLLPIIRTFISLPAGIAEMDIKKFIIYTVIGSIPYVFALGYIGVLLGPSWPRIESYFNYLDILSIVLVILVVIYIVYEYGFKKRK